MKPTKLVIKNIGKIADTTIDINKPLILFYGEIKMGKTTILNCVRWVCGGEFPDDIISHGAKEGEIELHFDGGMIGRSFYRAKTGETKARAVVFVKNGKPVPSPVAEIKRLLNPFLLDQDFLRNKSELERKQYFAELFQVDTAALDTELFNSQREAQSLRAKISGYGEIDLTKVASVDVAVSQAQLARINATHDESCDKVDSDNETIRTHNAEYDRSEGAGIALKTEISRLKRELDEKENLLRDNDLWLNKNPKRQLKTKPAKPDTSVLEKQIQEAGATNVRAEQYQANVARAKAKTADETALSAMEKRQREIKAEKQAKLKTISSTCGIDGLEFDEAGNFIYDGTTAGMISDSQIMRLSSELSALYPDGFGLDLIDRAESLGKSIFEFVDKAKAENKSILATIVGERPATVPENVGVFVVEGGKITGELI